MRKFISIINIGGADMLVAGIFLLFLALLGLTDSLERMLDNNNGQAAFQIDGVCTLPIEGETTLATCPVVDPKQAVMNALQEQLKEAP